MSPLTEPRYVTRKHSFDKQRSQCVATRAACVSVGLLISVTEQNYELSLGKRTKAANES